MRAIYPGAFDPITHGHIDIIMRAMDIFDEIHVVVANNTVKNGLFSWGERVELIKKSLPASDKLVVTNHQGLIVDYAQRNDINVVLRGLRAVTDFEYELQIAHYNKALNKKVETFFLMANVEYSFLNSATVKEIAKFGGDVSKFVPKPVEEALTIKFKCDKEIF